ncbi:hypothetical protein SADUNF_Sadunf03G0109400 [Salix dunnii]|uniref:Uncharacterized protein n=1 Tax=Salix dunnii TaxID=1413687 RepID=A0A835KHT0_9ROSI|nr:hypothetical protein SADUNF_Sadunf03G0109400 [Salix dunnii]
MGRAPCCSKVGLHRGPWTTREDALLVNYIQKHGEGHWRSLPNKAGLLRCGKSCRLRWLNYLRPDIKRGNITPEEDDLIIRLHSLLGNRWSLIAGRLPGRTDNEIKNYWNSHLSKKVQVRNNENGSKFKKQSAGRKRIVSKLNDKRKQKDNEEATTRTKIHAPKARRVSPSSVNISTNNSMVGSSSHTGSGDHDSNWSMSHLEADKNIDGDLAWAPDHYLDDLVQDDLSGQDYSPANIDNMLEEMFGEYQQLLNTDNHAQLLDSFVDSLLA